MHLFLYICKTFLRYFIGYEEIISDLDMLYHWYLQIFAVRVEKVIGVTK